MASSTLYPPVIDDFRPAFPASIADDDNLFYFSLSKFNATKDVASIHVSVVKQDTGMNVVKAVDDPIPEGATPEAIEKIHFRGTGIITNVAYSKIDGEENLYSFVIPKSDLYVKDNTDGNSYQGWIPGWIYKIQIRLSSVNYDGSIPLAEWLNRNASNFSEWSTVCVTKAIGNIGVNIPLLGIEYPKNENISEKEEVIPNLNITTMDLFGNIVSEDPSEVLYRYNLKLYNAEDTLLEDSGDLYSNQYQDINSFRYLFKYEFKNGSDYRIDFYYETNNGYSNNISKIFDVSVVQIDRPNCSILTIESDPTGEIFVGDHYSSVEEEQEEGRIALKLYSDSIDPYSGNLCIRRTSMHSNFQEWIDIKIFVVKEEDINTLPFIYDYSIESGVWYQYGVQIIDRYGNRGIMNIGRKVMRDFEYSYLLGENNQQLKLKFNNTMGSYKIQLMEGKSETIGGVYPIVARNAALKYKIFPINGTISFQMDENHLFCNKKVIYGSDEIASLYDKYSADLDYVPTSREHKHHDQYEGDSPEYAEGRSPASEQGNVKLAQDDYDYIYERDFRKLVLDFLHDGKPKLFKSTTEGNVIVRLTEINCTPNQTLDRMIYDFTSTGNEIAEYNYENCLKYNFLNPGNWAPSFDTTTTHIGQIQMDFVGFGAGNPTNIIEEIYKKYDSLGKNLGGYKKTVMGIHHIKITIGEKPFRVINNAGEIVLGHNLRVSRLANGTDTITVYDPRGIYEFDEHLVYNDSDYLYIEAESNVENPNPRTTINATVDFLYDIKSDIYVEKEPQSRVVRTGVGQLFGEFAPGTLLHDKIAYKYSIDWEDKFSYLNSITSIELEANPGTVFKIKDSAAGSTEEEHEINDTGVLRLFEINTIDKLVYEGIRNADGTIDETKPANILVNYCYTLVQGEYKERT